VDFRALKTLVFAGGGTRGIAYVGALQELRDSDGIDFGLGVPRLKTVSGVSVGTIFALLIALQFSVPDITLIAKGMKNADVLDQDPMRLLNGELSFSSSEKLETFITQLLIKRNMSPDLTFQQLYDKNSIDMHVVVSDLTSGGVQHIDRYSYPNLKITTGMIASMSLPLLYPPVLSPEGHQWVDGGLLENYPAMRFDADTMLGFDFTFKPEGKFDTLFSYINRIINVQQVPADIMHWRILPEAHKRRTIVIDTDSISTISGTLQEMTPEMRKMLLRHGAQAVKNYKLGITQIPPGIIGNINVSILPTYLQEKR
jgi:predicted acylesterase/phospholipase RssA